MSSDPKLREGLKRATGELRKANRRLRALDEPIAIVGMGCRYPGGVDSPEGLWRLVSEGRDAIAPFPADRGWDLERIHDPDPDRPGTTYTRHGGFLDDPGAFDPAFFGIGRAEALLMDPQQRLLLETCWEACESAGIDPATLHGTPAGVFAGVMYQDYGADLWTAAHGPLRDGLDAYAGTGSSGSVASGRVAYLLGLEGPAITIDTACSSSLVALHLATQALRRGECSIAFAGGATVLATPRVFIELSRQRGLAPDGRCKPFAAAADGTGWSEGAGVLLLERLVDAQRNDHPVLALVRGSAVNQDGASNGLTAPNGPSQQRVIHTALEQARLKAGDIDAVEAHGTGTTLGDPIEAQALLATYGRSRQAERPLRLGSIKSNIGHAQAAAGVAGVIKMVQALRHGELPRTLHVDAPTPHVDWAAGSVELLTDAQPWPADAERPRRAGVSSFGISGTNAHVILEQAPAPPTVASAPARNGAAAPPGATPETAATPELPALDGPAQWILSAASDDALRAQARRLRERLEASPELAPVDVAWTLAHGRSRLARRAVVTDGDRAQRLAALDALSRGDAGAANLVTGSAVHGAAALLFPGQGSQWPGMACGLVDASPSFAAELAACEAALEPFVGWRLIDVLRGVEGAPSLERVDVVQPALFAVMVSLAALWRACGVSPSAVVGHSQGEIAAAYVAGGLSLEDAARVVALRSKALLALSGNGGMISLTLPLAEVVERTAQYGERVAIAALNGPASVVVSGDLDALDELAASCDREGIRAKRIPVDYASHSAQVETIREELLDALAPIRPRSGDLPFWSTVTGELLDTAELNADYWYRNLRHTVRLEPVVRRLLASDATVLIEVSPHPVLTIGVQETIDDAADDVDEVRLLATLRRDEPEPARFVQVLAGAHVHGAAVDWSALLSGGSHVDLPTYAFQRERYWLAPREPAEGGIAGAGQAADHPLLASAVSLADSQGALFTGRLSLTTHPWLADHGADGRATMPATALLELALHAARQTGSAGVEELMLEAPIVFADDLVVELQVAVGDADEHGTSAIVISSRSREAGEEVGWRQPWTRNASGLLAAPDLEAAEHPEPLAPAWPPAGAVAVDLDALYDRLEAGGVEIGPAFQGLTAAWQRGDECFAEVTPAEESLEDSGRYGIHPALLDAGLHVMGLLAQDDTTPLRPFVWNGVRLHAPGAEALRLHVTAPREQAIAAEIFDHRGAPVATIGSLTLRPVPPQPSDDEAPAPAAGSRRGAPRHPRRSRTRATRLADRLATTPEDERERVVLDLVREAIAEVLGDRAPASVAGDQSFKQLGLTSITGVELRNALRRASGVLLPATAVFDHPTPEDVARALLEAALPESDATGVRRTRARRQRAVDEPIAIVGMACRYPGGVATPEELWALVAAGRDAIGDFPDDRGWDVARIYDPDPDSVGTTYTRAGGFVERAGEFDAAFFGVSSREALAMDPQQRLLLEACWEAIEAAGVNPTSLRGSETGVFAGINVQDYGPGLSPVAEDALPPGVEGYIGTGVAGSVASGRIAFALGLEGPAMTIDTACSSSLVALHLAGQALRGGECTLALAGGVTILSTPGMFVDFSRQRGLAADGRCKAFADAADGTGFAEGVGVLLLERLSDARRNDHRVLAVVRGSAVNQDGASNGLTAPNGPSQQRVIRQALANAGLEPTDVDAVDAHGTGTTLGDPIEAQALLATYGQARPDDRPLWLGSLKSNIGHAQAAAGVGAIIKMVQALRHGELPRTLHVDAPSTQVDWDSGAVALLTEPRPWPRDNERPRRAGISAFGISGTNAHVLIEEPAMPPVATPAPVALAGTAPWPLSGASDEALRAQARRLHARLSGAPDLQPIDVGWTLAQGRAALPFRAVVTGGDREQRLQALEALGHGEADANVVHATASAASGSCAFLFPGQGSQWPGMACGLVDASPTFATELTACQAALEPFVEWQLMDVLRGGEGAPSLERVDVVQPVLFAVMVSLAALWRASGVSPSAVVGHSQGEIAAAYVAGGLSLEDAARVVALRSKALVALSGHGGMVSLTAPLAEVSERVRRFGQRIAIAAVNGPLSVVVSGDPDALDELVASCDTDGVRAKRIAVDYASHSAQVETIREELLDALAPIRPHSGGVPFWSTVTGELLDTAELDADYWYRNLRQTVSLEPVVRGLVGRGARLLVEVSPHPVLTMGVQATVDEAASESEPVAVLGTLRRDEPEPERFAHVLASAHVHGAVVDWGALLAGGRLVELPTYAFQRQRYWLTAPTLAGGAPEATGQLGAGHPLLGAAVELAQTDGLLLTARLALQTHPWLADHAVMGTVLLPGTAFLEIALHAARRLGCDGIEELALEAPLVLGDNGAIELQVAVDGLDEDGTRTIAIHSRPQRDADEEAWQRNATGTLAAPAIASQSSAATADAARLAGGAWPPPGAEPLDVEQLHDRLAAHALDYGPSFRGLRAAWRHDDELFAEVALPEQQAQHADRFGLHPALLDAVVQTLAADAPDAPPAGAAASARLPFAWRQVRLLRAGATTLRARLVQNDEGSFSVTVADTRGEVVLTADQLTLRPIAAAQLAAAGGVRSDALYRLDWPALATPAGDAGAGAGAVAPPSSLACLGEQDGELVASLRQAGLDAVAHPDLDALPDPVPPVVLAQAGTGQADDPAAVHATVRSTLALLQQWLADERFAAARLVLVTRGALAVAPEDAVTDLAAASARGLVRAAQSEHPDRIVLLDVDDTSWPALPIALASGEPQLALRDGAVHVARLARATAPPTALGSAAAAFGGPEATVLITGGTGTLGRRVARHLAAVHGVGHLLLASRRGSDSPGAHDLERELTALGARVTFAACDTTDRATVAEMLASIPPELPLRAVVHAAGVLDDATIGSLSVERLDAVLAPKVDGALHLDELTAGLNLSAFVLFSSSAALFGGLGQGGYCAANALVDALAQRRRARGEAATSLGWGLWADASAMTDRLGDVDRARMARVGLVAMDANEALALLDAVVAGAGPDSASNADGASDAVRYPMRLDGGRLRALARGGDVPSVLRGLVRGDASGGARGAFARQLVGRSADERRRALLELVVREAEQVLGQRAAQAVAPDRAFKELGFDSLAAVELRNRLAAATGLRLPVTLIFDHPTPVAVAGELSAQLGDATASGARSPVARRTAADEPIAIVGMACRYPGGVQSPDDLWRLLDRGTDAIVPFPEDRGWDLDRLLDGDPDLAGTSVARSGGFVDGAGDFDAAFFGIGPREALVMDPQQRLLLETSWEAIENAGIDPNSLRGSRTGAFVGIMSQDYGPGLAAMPAELEGYMGTGLAASVASGRVAYTLGLEGPALTVDTACSSSLVALHLAIQALRRGECSLALAGGATVLASPGVFVAFSRQRGLAPDGRCKPFADAANGTGWGEGAGVLLVERLSAAQRNGHPVLAVVRGSAVNQDGASNGLTAPNGPSQQRLIHEALADAGLTTADVDAVEAHGTGTTLGDPVEAHALLATYGRERAAERPLKLGSIKSNIGHTQAAAGVAGVIKMVLALQHDQLPATLHVDAPTSQVDWSAGGVELLTEAQPWPTAAAPRRAAVSSFGVSGTNAHVVLEEAPPQTAAPAQPADAADAGAAAAGPWILSARSEAALRGQAARLQRHLRMPDGPDVADVAWTMATGRALHEHRAVVLGDGRDDLLAGLGALARGERAGNVVTGRAERGRIAFLFTGQGAQRVGMGRELHARLPAFAQAFDAAADRLSDLLDDDVRALAFGERPDASDRLDGTAFAQAALFALGVACFRALDHHGVRPDLVAGHSIGELTAAHVAGVLSLDDACRLVAARGRLMQALPAGGAMASLEASEEEALRLLEATTTADGGQLGIAAVNGPRAVVLSGDQPAVEAAVEAWRARGRRAKRLRVSHAFHSPHMDPMLAEFSATAAALTFTAPAIPLVSTLTGELATADQLSAPGHWARHVREPVRFLDAVRALAAEGATRFLELGPDGVLSAMARDCLDAEAADGQAPLLAPLLRAGRPEPATFAAALAEAHVRGVSVDWTRVLGKGRCVPLPTYAFARERFWLAPTNAGADAAALGAAAADHPLLGAAMELADGDGVLLTGRLSLETHPWLADHAVAGTVLLPGAALVELALRAGAEVGCHRLQELTLEAPLIIAEQHVVQLQVKVGEPDEDGRRPLAVHARREAGDGRWTCHGRGSIAPAPAAETRAASDAAPWPPADAEPVSLDGVYERLADRALDYGPAFRGLRAAWRRGDEVFAEVALPPVEQESAARYLLHPALLDAALQAAGLELLDDDGGDGDDARLPFAWGEVAVHRVGQASARVHGRSGDGRLTLTLTGADGAPLATVGSLAVRTVAADELRRAADATDCAYRLAWTPLEARPATTAPSWAILGTPPDGCEAGLGAEGPAPRTHADLAALRAALDDGEPLPDLVIADCAEDPHQAARAARDARTSATATRAALHRTLALVQAWLTDERLTASRLVVRTRGGVAADAGDDTDDAAMSVAAAAVWGLVRSAQSEHPERFVLLDDDGEPASWAALTAAVASDEPQLALRGGHALVPRVARTGPPVPAHNSPRFDPDDTVLVTGATGALGALVARHLVAEHGVGHLLLLSRRGPDAPTASALATELTAHGAQVTIVACDAGDRDQLAAAIAAIAPEHPLRGVVHAAGMLDDGVVETLTAERIDGVLASKADAAFHLHELTAAHDLRAFVLFSSMAATIGAPGQGNYAAANAVLEALARRRRADGRAATAMAWGPWKLGDGMADGLARGDAARLQRSGAEALAAADGLALFDRALADAEAVALLARLDRSALRAQEQRGVLPPLLRGLAPGRRTKPAGPSLAQRLAGLEPDARTREVLEAVRAEVAAVLGHASPEAIDPRRAFKELGFDSLAAVELRNRLGTATGLRLPPTLVFDHPSPQAVADHLVATLLPGADDASDPSPADAPTLAQLARRGGAEEAAEDSEAIATMDVESLLRAAQDARPTTDEEAAG